MLTPEPEISPDLEWMLSSTQASHQFFNDTAIKEYGVPLLRLASILLDDPELANDCVFAGLESAFSQRHRYRSEITIQSWLMQHVYIACVKRLPKLRFQRAWRALSPTQDYHHQISTNLPTRMQEADLWLAVDKLPEHLRSTYLLHTVLEISVDEISIIMRSSRSRVNQRLWASLSRLTKNGALQIDPARSLQSRWPAQPLTKTVENFPQGIRDIDTPRQTGKTLNAFLFILLVMSIAWLGGYLNKISPPGASVETVVRTVVVTQKVLVTRMVSPTPTPLATVQPLHAHTSPYEIQQRIASITKTGWQTLFLDMVYYYYGPAGYLGPPQTYRSQIWYQNPHQGQARVNILSGDGYGAPQVASLIENHQVYEIDLENGLSSIYPENQQQANEHLPPEYVRELSKLHGLRDGSFLINRLFAQELAENIDHVTVIGEQDILDRPAIVLEYWHRNQARQLFWIDAEYGLVLRWQMYDFDSPGTIVEELYPLSLAWNETFPEAALSRTFYWKQTIGWESIAVPEISPAPTPDWQTIRENMDASNPNLKNIAPANSYITFHWLGTSARSVELSTNIQVRADNFVLGNLSISNPFDLVCERSPDGNKLAFVQPPTGPDGILYSPSAPSWADLSDREFITHSTLPNAIFSSSDFEFSPDSTRLAFWGCGVKEDNCGIYIHDLKTRKNTKLIGLQSGAIYFKWSPDGQMLAMVGAGPNMKYDSSLLVLLVAGGSIVYEGEFQWPGYQIPQDAPSWLVDYPPKRTRLENCLGWPEP